MRGLAAMAGILALAALPASAATERIPLRYARAADVEQIIVGAPPRASGTGGLGGSSRPRGSVPEGITLLTSATTPNELVVDGTPEGIAEVRKLVRLLDVPARRVKVHVRIYPGNLPVDEGVDVPESRENHLAAAFSEKEFVKLTRGGPAPLAEAQLEGENNRPVRVFWPLRGKSTVGSATITPRVNGDNQISVWISPGAQATSPPPGSARMLKSQASAPYLVVSMPDAEVVLVLQVEAVPVDPPK